MAEVYKVSVSAPRQRLIELLQRLNYGVIENLCVRNGDPVFNPAPRVVRDVKLMGNADNGPRVEYGRSNFKLKAAVIELFDLLDELGDGAIDLIEVRGGLPARVLIQESVNF
jgi:hypothetical protein